MIPDRAGAAEGARRAWLPLPPLRHPPRSKPAVVGALYNVSTGEVEFLDGE